MTRDTIAAIATAQGPGALAVVRMSGSAAHDALASLLAPAAAPPPLREARLRAIHHPETGELIDRAVVVRFRRPDSFTGEDAVEISCHGGRLTPALVLEASLAAGCRQAEPGEFTRRAHLNGRLDLLQAEAIAELIEADSPALRRAAVHRMERGLSERIDALRASLIEVDALLSYGIDFPDEDEPPVADEVILGRAESVLERIDGLLRTAPEGERLRKGALVVLAGRPNVGKSALFNALLGRERAIVTEVAGTTRDALEADATIDGYPFRLVDTAGLRPTGDRIEEMGIEVARRYLDAADIVVFCAERGRELTPEEASFLDADPGRTLRVESKADVGDGEGRGDRGIAVSARTGEGIDTLMREIRRRAFGGPAGDPGEVPLLTRARHVRALRSSAAALGRFIETLRQGEAAEFAAVHLHEGVGALEDLIGRVSPDDVLDEVFGRFCVGK